MSIRSEFVRLWNEFMANAKKITQLTSLPSPVANSDLFEVVRGGVNYKALGSQLPSGGGGGSVVSVTGDFVDNTDPTNPVVTGLTAALALKESLYRPFDRKTSNYPLVLADASRGIEMNMAGANTVTVPLNATQAFPVGTLIPVVQYGAGLTSVVATGGVTINTSAGNLDSPGQYAPMFLRKIATDEWYLWNGTAGVGGDLQDTLDLGSTAVITSDVSIIRTGAFTFALDAAAGISLITQSQPITLNTTTGDFNFVKAGVGRFWTNGHNNYETPNLGFHRFYNVSDGATLRLMELGSNGSNYIDLKAPAQVTTAQTYTFPAAGPASNGQALASQTDGTLSWVTPPPKVIQTACSDETTALTTGTKVTFRMPYAMTLTAVRASLTTAQASGSIFTVDIQEAGVTVLSTLITIDNTEKTSTTAVAAPVISDAALADDAEITIIITQIGASGAAGLKVSLIGT